MSGGAVSVVGMGVVSALGAGTGRTVRALLEGRRGLRPLSVFPVASGDPLPVGEVDLDEGGASPLPRTHRLALLAADQALAGAPGPVDAIVLGTTTGGILRTEALLEAGCADPDAYRHHGAGTIAEALAGRCGCRGPLITVSTACSSGAVAIALGMALLRRGLARRVLAGGADSLCRLTYFGFDSLQLIDPLGSRPLDRDRHGMSVAEGAALLLLTTGEPSGEAAQILGAGLSCDAHHAAAPHPEGLGAVSAMRAALADAGLAPEEIDYVNLHGTGTVDNDLAEARAVVSLFGEHPPPLSSIKGATGHSLAAAGAIEAVVSALAVRQGFVPPNAGLARVDPQLKLAPVTAPGRRSVGTVLSNSFGFGGNNAALVVGKAAPFPCSRLRGRISSRDKAPDESRLRRTSGYAAGRDEEGQRSRRPKDGPALTIAAAACLTGAGRSQATWERFASGGACGGCLDEQVVSAGLPPRLIRRLKRLSRIALGLAVEACAGAPVDGAPLAVCLGTAWGALSETHDFLQRLFETRQQFPSPTDFVGSVHNAAAGQVAMHLGARGANVTTTGGDASFEQALLAADLLVDGPDQPVLVLGVDEGHPSLSPLLDGSVRGAPLADGGGALLLRRGRPGEPTISLAGSRCDSGPEAMRSLLEAAGGPGTVRRAVGAILAGIPAAHADAASRDLAAFVEASGFAGPVIDYRRGIGQFGAASAVAAVLAHRMVLAQAVPAALAGGSDLPLAGRGVLLLGLGTSTSAVMVAPP